MKNYKVIVFILFFSQQLYGQTISSFIPNEIKKSARYLFYLHGGVVTNLGNNAINQSVPQYGPYEYLNILETLKKRGFYVISERRYANVNDTAYANKICNQIDSLLKAGVNPKSVTVLGASAGKDIGLKVSAKLRNIKLGFIIMGGCWPDEYKSYLDTELYGNYLSIIEASDPHGTCSAIFKDRKYVKRFQEVKLNNGLSHGFIYKGYKDWVDIVVKWCKIK